MASESQYTGTVTQKPEQRRVVVEAVYAALADERWAFRTVDGIARETSLEPSVVTEVMRTNPGIARKSAMIGRNGEALYTKAERRMTIRERLEQLRWLLAH